MINYTDGNKNREYKYQGFPNTRKYPIQIFILDRSELTNGVNYVFLDYKHCIL